MDFKLIWNDLCHGIKKVEKEEKSARIFIEGVFGRLGWSLSENEIIRKEKAEEGETPDIIVAKNNESLFAVGATMPVTRFSTGLAKVTGTFLLVRMAV